MMAPKKGAPPKADDGGLMAGRPNLSEPPSTHQNPHSPDDALICATLAPIQIKAIAPYPRSSETVMAHPMGESESDAVRLDFDRRLVLQFRGSVVTSDASTGGHTIRRCCMHCARLRDLL
jgi:hypothetical protein